MLLNRSCHAGEKTDVYLDGKKLKYCFEADDKKGYAIIAKTYRNGRLVPANRAESGDLLLDGVVVERVEGRISFRNNEMSRAAMEADSERVCVRLEFTRVP